MNLTPASELFDRIARLQAALGACDWAAVVLVQSADLFYFTGTVQTGALYVPVAGEPVYLVRKDLQRARRESALERIEPMPALRDLSSTLRAHGYPTPTRIGFEYDVLPVAVFERYRRVFPASECVDASALIRRVRMIKSAYEIERIRRAAAQADAVYRRAREVIRVGMSDIELAAELEHFARLQGHPGIIRMRSFNGEMLFAHVFSGPDAAAPAYLDTPLGGVGAHPSFGQGASWQRIEAHRPIIVDTGSFVDGYLADQTRTLSVGELPDALRDAYGHMLKVQQLMESSVKPGVVWADVYNACFALAAGLGYTEHFMGAKGAQAGFIGHGLGIEIDELPIVAPSFTDDVFQTAMTFAFEPKLVFPGQGAVGIENTYVVHPNGIEKLTYSDEAIGILVTQ